MMFSVDQVLRWKQLLQKLVRRQRSNWDEYKLDRSLLEIQEHDSSTTGDQGGGGTGELIKVGKVGHLLLGFVALITCASPPKQPKVGMVARPHGCREGRRVQLDVGRPQ